MRMASMGLQRVVKEPVADKEEREDDGKNAR